MARQGTYTRKVGKIRQTKRTSKRFWRWFKGLSKPKKFLLIGGPILAFLILTPLLTYAYYYNDIADQERLMNRNNTGIVLTDKNGATIYSTGKAQHRNIVPLSAISDQLEHAVIASEDKDFYEHEGFSIAGIFRALFGNLSSGSITGGGSTITQQLAKNTLLTEQQTFLRKYQELAISIAIEQRYSKDEILDMYLNSAFFGGNVFGIEEAAKFYFNKTPADLNLAESSMLIGILPAPNAYSPTLGSPEYAKQRQTTVLTRMVTNGYISEAEKTAALAEVLAYAPVKDASTESEAPHFAEMVLKELNEKYGEEKVQRAGYQVQTTLDLNLQRQVMASVQKNLKYIQRNGGSNASGVAIDPTSGEIRALVGSADWNNAEWGKVNMVTTARQPGSSFKPIYYSEALAEGVITPATIFADVPTDFNGYKPQNATKTYSGDISVRNALARSLNIPSVRVMQKLGINASVEAANRMGIPIDENKNYGLSLALGSAEAPLLQMTNAYAAFSQNGQQHTPTTIQKVDDKYDATIYTSSKNSKEVISLEGAFLISSILSDNNARAPIFGSSLTVPGRTAAVKTGTTDDQRDAWTIGYTPQLAVGVWVGNNNNTVMLNGGSGMAGPIWVNTMKEALKGVPNAAFTVPGGIVQKPVCYSNGGLASSAGNGTYNEYFLSSALPTATCSPVKEQPKEQKKEEEPEEKPQEEEDDTSSGSGGTGNSGGDTGTGNNGGTTNPGTGTGGGSGNNGGSSGGNTGGGTITPPTGGGTLNP